MQYVYVYNTILYNILYIYIYIIIYIYMSLHTLCEVDTNKGYRANVIPFANKKC